MLVIGLTGKRGCGKDEVANRMVEQHGFTMLDFTKDILSPILRKKGQAVTRENLINLAMSGRKHSHAGIWAEKMAAKIKRSGSKGRGAKPGFVISGVRFREEVDVFRKSFGHGFRLVAIICDDRTRWQRARKRGTKGEADLNFRQFMLTEKRETEKAITKTLGIADYAIDNNGTLLDLYSEVSGLMKILKSQS